MSATNIEAKSSTHWYTLTVEESLKSLESGPHGLSSDEAARRLEKFGPNELQAQGRVSPWTILLEQFKNVLIIILLLATALSAEDLNGPEREVLRAHPFGPRGLRSMSGGGVSGSFQRMYGLSFSS